MMSNCHLNNVESELFAILIMVMIIICLCILDSYKHVVDGVRRVTMEGMIIKLMYIVYVIIGASRLCFRSFCHARGFLQAVERCLTERSLSGLDDTIASKFLIFH